jgi:hypothetical protein
VDPVDHPGRPPSTATVRTVLCGRQQARDSGP